ncbi:cation transporting ATPase C-terminal domain-containing protein [Blautia sp. MSJ-36]|nr:cation transporting ATPase C-terminal domain-containing protein [Blautia sp. MSJ-36]
MLQMFVLALSLYNTWNRGVFLLCKITNLLIYSENIKKAIQFLLSGNFAAILVVIVASLMSLPVPFAPVHLLFINLLTDSLPAIALGLEPYHHDVMGEKPRPVKESILTKDFLTRIGVEGGVIGAVVLAGFVLLTVVLTVPALHGFFVVQTLKMGELLTVYGLSGLSMLVIQGLKQVVKF